MTDAEPFRLPPRLLGAVATGEPDEADLALLRSAQHSRLLLALVAILTSPGHADGAGPRGRRAPTRPSVSWELLAHTQRSAPEAVAAVLADPAVGAWAFQLLRRLDHGTVATPGDAPRWAGTALFGSLTGAAALRSGIRATLRVPARKGQLWLPSLGVTGSVGRGAWPVVTLDCGPRGAVVHGDGGSVRLPGDLERASEGWYPLPRVDRDTPAGRAPLTLDHLSPYRDFRAVKDPAQLPRKTLRRWHALLRESDALLLRQHPSARRLVSGTVRTVVPVDGPSELLAVSATAPDAFGTVTMSLPGDAQATAAILVHEARHQLLSALAELTPLTVSVRQGPQPAYFTPWRSDPRPLRGLLYGAHAFTGVMAFWSARRAEDGERAEFEFAVHRWQVRTALAALRNATGLTRAGGTVVTGLLAEVAGLGTEPVGGPAGRLAGLCCRDVTATWRAAHLAVDAGDAAGLAGRWLAGRPPPRVLPASRLRAARTGTPRAPDTGAARTWLARLRFTDPRGFDGVRAQLAAGTAHPLGIRDATPADALLAGGETDAAHAAYRRQPPSLPSWIGGALTAPGDRGAPFLERPELALALRGALAALGASAPGPHELAAWLGSRDPVAGVPRSDAQQVDVAVGPDPVDRVPGRLVIGPQRPPA
ncbi:HEXXH motif domain-containing protein [Streptomyces beigongshangae]|uniref:HEXXH motif domain-containing protein n=1 Tax=Streptomyces beigongshangae TaxID=2841597 RepID=UPI001C8504FC|nr:HEXXH motif domain-containing protein [Streptomyces sp. REN17]